MFAATTSFETRNAEVEFEFEFDNSNLDYDGEDVWGFSNLDGVEINEINTLINDRVRKLDYAKMSEVNKARVRKAIMEYGDTDNFHRVLNEYDEPPSYLVDALEEQHRLTGRW